MAHQADVCLAVDHYYTHFKSESDPHSYKATKAVAKKAQKKFWGSTRIGTLVFHDTDAMPYWLSYEA